MQRPARGDSKKADDGNHKVSMYWGVENEGILTADLLSILAHDLMRGRAACAG